MNIIKLLLGRGIFNAPVLNQIDENNKERVNLLLDDIETDLGYRISPEVIRVLAVKRLLDCYSKKDIIRILEHFKMLKGGN